MGARTAGGRDNMKSLAGGLVSRVQRAWGESPFYQSQLRGPAPDRLLYKFDDPYTPDREEGARIRDGLFTLAAERVDCAGEPGAVWGQLGRDGPLYRAAHQFTWLRALSALGEGGQDAAVALTASWLEANEKWAPETWEAALTAERLVNLCAHADLVLKGTDVLWRSRVLTSMARQLRHLMQCAHKARGNYDRLQCAAALTLAGLCLPGCATGVERGLELLRRELRLQLRNDGGHVSRNPSQQLAILIRLQIICQAMRARDMGEPGFLRHMMGRIGAHAALFRLGDGGLAIFSGGSEDDARALSRALAHVDNTVEAARFARYSGYQRIEAGKSVLIADFGPARATGAGGDRHREPHGHQAGAPAGTRAALQTTLPSGPASAWRSDGSFNISVGKARLVVNCGTGAHLPGEWSAALKQAGAHSTLSSEPPDVLARAFAGAQTSHRRGDDPDGFLVEIDRRFAAIGARHGRLLFLTRDGASLRGEDRLAGFPASALAAMRLRFHLHPSVRASLSRDRRSVILALANGEGWVFRTNYRLMSLEKSIYCGEGGLPQPCDQITLTGPGLSHGLDDASRGDMVFKWAFTRLDPA